MCWICLEDALLHDVQKISPKGANGEEEMCFVKAGSENRWVIQHVGMVMREPRTARAPSLDAMYAH